MQADARQNQFHSGRCPSSPGGDLWFTENVANKFGRIKPDGSMVGENEIPTPGSGARSIVAAPDGRLFLTQYDIGCIGECARDLRSRHGLRIVRKISRTALH
jgi:streptogramin lyase